MDILLCGRFDTGERELWRSALAAAWPQGHWLDEAGARAAPEQVRAAVVANPPPGALQGLPNLALVQSLWAGVERLVTDPTLPAQVPLARMVDPMMSVAMAETAHWAVLSLHRDFVAYARQQRQRQWLPHPQRRADEVRVLVLGRGELGRTVGRRLADAGYQVAFWARDDDLDSALPQADVVINLLPLTPATRGLIDARFLARLPAGAALVNLARGGHVVEADLLAALERGPLRHAVLDVFAQEPLPSDHAFWTHERVTVLPHVAAATDPRSAAAVVAANLQALADGRPLAHLVDRTRGY
ncbi:2-hydroxyacid dehydrogenase [Rubrivivax albus]|uniref:Glyoxylate/hydroxypyruvate reductase A n=1 Tax=Rubrivivax albus TaxID=2499835 RepID=A0A437JXV6_9BURK|nr:glyoxylate/hydroxypyruvate reductase A [Rubrivivax albus]RVT52502.1 glyoxylate/hydroxypyruvate reductase A [Rubrivivax albus]